MSSGQMDNQSECGTFWVQITGVFGERKEVDYRGRKTLVDGGDGKLAIALDQAQVSIHPSNHVSE
jgi:uncharacterized protein YlaN (UPF0358 family)